ncbi:hypothetical protein IAT40_001794 [Kwoniella sp. CBS 6097]
MPEETPEPKFDEVYKNPEADLILVSSDDVSFKIFKYHLQSCSPVFRGMIAALGSANESLPTVTFTDPQIECAAVIRLFLDIVQAPPT